MRRGHKDAKTGYAFGMTPGLSSSLSATGPGCNSKSGFKYCLLPPTRLRAKRKPAGGIAVAWLAYCIYLILNLCSTYDQHRVGTQGCQATAQAGSPAPSAGARWCRNASSVPRGSQRQGADEPPLPLPATGWCLSRVLRVRGRYPDRPHRGGEKTR